jgi:hypothetical protein
LAVGAVHHFEVKFVLLLSTVPLERTVEGQAGKAKDKSIPHVGSSLR